MPINPLLKAEEIAHLCRAAGAKALVALGPLPGTEIWDKAMRVKALTPTLGVLIQVGGEKVIGDVEVRLLADLLQSSPPQLAFSDRPGLDDVAAYFHTGGTIHIVYGSRKNQPVAVRKLIEHLVDVLGDDASGRRQPVVNLVEDAVDYLVPNDPTLAALALVSRARGVARNGVRLAA